MSTKTITITDPDELGMPRVGDLVTERVTAVGPHGEYDTTTVRIEREVPELEPGMTGTATVHGEANQAVMRCYSRADDFWTTPSTVNGSRQHPDAAVTDFVPDATAPTVEQIAKVLAGKFGGHSDAYLDVASEVVAFQRGESR